MKIQSNYAYYSNLATNFSSRMRMHLNNNNNAQMPIRSKHNPNLLVYVYEDSNHDLDINQRTYDSFTGLRDKQYLLAVMNKKMQESQATGKNLSFAMFDMDNFKSVNELLGYETGDDFIKFISEGIDSAAKENGLCAYRFGGEEFVIIYDNQSEEAQKLMTDKVLRNINSNKYIKSKEQDYLTNANERMANYSVSTAKINALMELKAKKEIYDDLLENLSTDEAKNDPYLIQCEKETDEELTSQYMSLVCERVNCESDLKTKELLFNAIETYKKDGRLTNAQTNRLDEYLRFCYDKSAELFQIKKWLNDFRNNEGFSITGSVVSFRPEFMKDKTPMQLIGIAGESLKRGKQISKGKNYYA